MTASHGERGATSHGVQGQAERAASGASGGGWAGSARPGPEVSGAAVLVAVFVIATCGLIYELIAGTVASYVLGDSVTQFSTIIGVYLFAMGVGSWLSRFVDRNLVTRFIEVEIAVAILGGASSAVLFIAFAKLTWFRVILYVLVLLIGTLVGLEIPLLMRILQDRYALKDLVARVLSADYLGALLASLAFPLFLVPRLGLVRGAFAVGILNGAVALATTHLFRSSFVRARTAAFLRVEASAAIGVLVLGLVWSDAITSLGEESTYADPIVLAKSSPYQRIVVTRGKSGFDLFINGNLQFASPDEHRYHEALVHPAMSALHERRGEVGLRPAGPPGQAIDVLVLGGGDGLALREILKYGDVRAVTLVDLDPAMTDLGRDFSLLRAQNRDAFRDPHVTVVNADAMIWIGDEEQAERRFQLIVADFPDPSTFTLGKLYTTAFYRRVARLLSEDGVLVVQATSPLLARRAFWCVAETMEQAGLFVRAYHAAVPSFGEWGYLLAAHRELPIPSTLADVELQYLDTETLRALFIFPRDMSRVPVEANHLNNQILVQYYEDEWDRWN